MAELSRQNWLIYGELKESKVLVDVEGHRLDQTQGVNLITCADGDQFPDIFLFHHQRLACTRLQVFSLLGGALLIDPEFPLNKKLQEDRVLLHHLKLGSEKKKIQTTVPYTHATCLAAMIAGYNLAKIIAGHMRSKQRIRAEVPPHHVIAPFVQVHHRVQRTHFFDRESFEPWFSVSWRKLDPQSEGVYIRP